MVQPGSLIVGPGGHQMRAANHVTTVDHVTDHSGRVLIPGLLPARFAFQHTQAGRLSAAGAVVGGLAVDRGGLAQAHQSGLDGWLGPRHPRLLAEGARGRTGNGQPEIAFPWYRGFIQLLVDSHAQGWFSKLIAFGELAVGIALVLGAFTGLAAAGGLLMSESYMLAGTAATNPLLALLEILLILAWKNAGDIGLDRFLLPNLIPWWSPRDAGFDRAEGRRRTADRVPSGPGHQTFR